ncbi:hypothetical protein [Criblamydia sequanensis]|uniref:Uncharacterized protein n=1 Tax=Candidatus Criblamydia sequanensis CRIB-18 TaxID=1437425 RepID=A0A090D1U3_9BACT|nr:hypothetical protein [Criblamydia sequanensis]CDR33753.1 hypothetical protein CSEC_0926 [Criblamydia sequanensis CRIB-18]
MSFDLNAALSSMHRAILGMVSSNLRGIRIEEKNGCLWIYFYYENSPSEEEEEMVNFIYTEFVSDFPDQKTDFKVISLPRNEMIPKIGEAVYLRYGELGPV